ncbi:MAG TPA: class I SAM-dependent methyltransferase, partial [Polyangiaceae bacterium]|nr:class I SAM-dependent methyltransferase [Polyangiaceae bacterium]
MRPGESSKTAVFVCAGRALAHGAAGVGAFSDPTALALLPEAERAWVERARAHQLPQSGRERWVLAAAERRAMMMVARTVAIDEMVRAAACRQVVVLGAGLDGRAWRMPELADATVFEVDHPDSQVVKQARVRGLTQLAREVRFVAVDFTRDDLERALASAGHDPAQPTAWVWEGVVMYLTRAEVSATLAVIARRSAVGSRLFTYYHRPGLLMLLVGVWVRRLGEPFRSTFGVAAMRRLLAKHGFRVMSDDGLPSLGA